MRGSEKGFLLLCSHLGNPDRKPLTTGQFRTLACRAQTVEPDAHMGELTVQDLKRLGYHEAMAERIWCLLQEEDLLEYYLRQGKAASCQPIVRISPEYPLILRKRLGLESPGCLWAKGDLSLLGKPAVSLVGSRDLHEPNRAFAEAVGTQAALQGIVLVSGNARGADRTAQDACLAAGGEVISIVADRLSRHAARDRVLYLSEEEYDEDFSSLRALSRNRCIHAMGHMTFVAQCQNGKGGTWDGTVKNLRHGWSPVACFRDGSEAARTLERQGAYLVGLEDLQDLALLAQSEPSLFDPC